MYDIIWILIEIKGLLEINVFFDFLYDLVWILLVVEDYENLGIYLI